MSLEVTKESNNIYNSDIAGSYHKRAIFGGTILCQSVLAAYHAVDANMHLHSFQVYFLVRGDANCKTKYVVETIMDGRSFVKRSVSVQQKKTVIARMFLSFKLDEPSSEFNFTPRFPKVPGPDKCLSITDIIQNKLAANPVKDLEVRLQGYLDWLVDFPIHVRAMDADIQTLTKINTTNKIYNWCKLRDPTMLDFKNKSSKHGLIGFISDYIILQPILTMHCFDPVGFMISLDHVMWFHSHTFDPNQWMLLEAECNIAGNGTTVNSCRIWSHGGDLLATVMQEGVIRPQK